MNHWHSQYPLPQQTTSSIAQGYPILLLSVPLMVPRQLVVERYLDRALQQVERTHFTIVTCCSVPLHPPLFKHSNHPFCSFFRVFRNKTLTNLLHLNTRCQWNKLLWPGYFLPAFYAVHEHNSSVDEQYMQYLSKIRIIPPQLCTSFYITVEN